MKSEIRLFFLLLVFFTFFSCDLSTDNKDEDSTNNELSKNNFIVTFDTNGGSTISNQSIVQGEKITKPTNPSKSGYNFDDWYKDTNFTSKWDFSSDTVESNITLYAKWTIIKISFIVIFNTNGGSTISNQSIVQGEKIIKPTNPTKSGYNFDDWYKDTNFTLKWDFSNDTVESNLNLYAKWTIIETVSVPKTWDGVYKWGNDIRMYIADGKIYWATDLILETEIINGIPPMNKLMLKAPKTPSPYVWVLEGNKLIEKSKTTEATIYSQYIFDSLTNNITYSSLNSEILFVLYVN